MRAAFLALIAMFGLYGQSNRPPEVQDVEAFIPNLHWLKRVEPVWPDQARSENLQGTVELLVTLDSNGLVTGTEPLTGPQILRQAAADAVAQWQFQPVIRNGHPVRAITTEGVFFRIPGQKLTPDRMGFNMTEQEAALKRTGDLRKRFPRSAEQVLADLEQATTGASARERFLFLPELAKAAVNAGDLNKATAYANESLDSSGFPTPLQKNGDGVHDGNMVLGLVALRGGDLWGAKQYLLKAGETTGSPVLGSFGPNMTLAKALLDAGERDVVVEYFAECRAF